MSTPTPIVVTECRDCPFVESRTHRTLWCQHPENSCPEDSEVTPISGLPWRGTRSVAPEWCHLRKSPALVVLRPEGLKSPPLGTE